MSIGWWLAWSCAPQSSGVFRLPPTETGITTTEITDSGNVEEDTNDTSIPGDSGRTRYPTDRIHSPLTKEVIAGLETIVAPNGTLPVFMKVGDSITYSSNYLHCFSDANGILGENSHLAPTLELYQEDNSSSFDRWSHAVQGGKTAHWALDGDPSPLQQEIDALDPSFAVVMFGTNDSGYYSPNTSKMIGWYGNRMMTLVETLIGQGIIPIVSTIPPRTNKPDVAVHVDLMNGVIRGIAEGYQIPLMDYHQLMAQAPDYGLSGDGVHPNHSGSPCNLSDDHLNFGYNLRNLVTLEALSRVENGLSNGALDVPVPVASGRGTHQDPWEIERLPFTWMADTSTSDSHRFDVYPDCGIQNESGPEHYFQIRLESETTLRLGVVDEDDTDVDIHVLSEEGCIAQADTLIEQSFPAGDYQIVIDTFASEDQRYAGQYLLVVIPGE